MVADLAEAPVEAELQWAVHPRGDQGLDFRLSTSDALRAINDGAPRLVGNLAIAGIPDGTEAAYWEAAELLAAAKKIDPTAEVLLGFEVAHLSAELVADLNKAMTTILDDTYARVANGEPRLLGTSSGYAHLYADRVFGIRAQEICAENILAGLARLVDPTSDQLVRLRDDMPPTPGSSPFADLHHGNHPYLPNILSSTVGTAEQVKPVTNDMDRRLARMIAELEVIKLFPTGEQVKNKSDSPHSLGNPRLLASDPANSLYLAERILHVAQTECQGDMLLGIASYGLGLALTASMLSSTTSRQLRYAYVKLADESWKGNERIEGVIRPGDAPILVDDLLFHGTTTRKAIKILGEDGRLKPVRDAIYVIDRQLQHRGKFPTSLTEEGLRVHRLITMDSIVRYLRQHGLLSDESLQNIIGDYRMHPDRIDMPTFAQEGQPV